MTLYSFVIKCQSFEKKVEHHMMNVLEHLRRYLVSFERQVETLHICGFFLALTVQDPRRMARLRSLDYASCYPTSDTFCPAQLDLHETNLRPVAKIYSLDCSQELL